MTDSLISLIVATALLLGAPGPAPLALAATGATYGVRGGAPFLGGILAGLTVAIAGAIAGMAALLAAWPGIRIAVQTAGGLYILYIAFKIAAAPALNEDRIPAKALPLFRDGFILNILNPKAYAAFVAIFSQFLLPISGVAPRYAATAAVCLLVGAAVDLAWLAAGGALRSIFEKPGPARALRVSFAVLMVAVTGLALWRI